MIGLLITLVLFPLAGRALRARSWSEAYLLGIGVVGVLLFVPPFRIGLAAAGLLAIVGLLNVARTLQSARGGLESPPPRLALTLTVVPLLVLAYIAAILPLNDFDGRAFWLLKAKAIAHEKAIDGPFFLGKRMYDPRNQYPLLMPLDAAAVMVLSRDADDREVRWLYLLTFAALLFQIRRRASPWAAAVVAWVPQFAAEVDGGALSGYSDIAVGAFVACAVFDILERRETWRIGLWLAFLVLTKNEGLPIALVLFVFAAIRFRRRALIAAAPMILAIIALLAWRHRIAPGDEEDLGALMLTLPTHLGRAFPAIGYFIQHLVLVNRWGLFWIAVVAALIIAWRRVALPAAIMVAICATYIAAYSVTTWIQRDLVNSSADRLLMQIIGPATVVLTLAMRPREVDESLLDID